MGQQDYETEALAAEDFDRRIDRMGLFSRSYAEVTGWYTSMRLNTADKRPRADRILLPGPKLREAGWTAGVIGVELKKDRDQLGRAISQVQSYQFAAFPLEGTPVVPVWWFIYPCVHVTGHLDSVMSQHRIGYSYQDRNIIRFGAGSSNCIKLMSGKITAKVPKCGNKIGSR